MYIPIGTIDKVKPWSYQNYQLLKEQFKKYETPILCHPLGNCI